jgi:hypothetical protein
MPDGKLHGRSDGVGSTGREIINNERQLEDSERAKKSAAPYTSKKHKGRLFPPEQFK